MGATEIHTPTWKTDSPLTGEVDGSDQIGFIGRTRTDGENRHTSQPRAVKCLEQEPRCVGAPAHSSTLSYPGKSQRPALPSACFSLQYKEGQKTKFFSRFGTRQDSVSISPPLPCYTSKMGCKPQLRIGRPHSGPQQHNWQAHLSLTELCRALGGGIMTLSS